MYMTKEAKAWKEAAQWEMKDSRYNLIEGPVEVVVNFYLKYDRDVENAKILFDALEGVVVKNDRQIEALHIFKEKEKDNPRVSIEVYELEE
jgi:Holliday junction resolvase RusA-like endonuclease